MASRYTSEDIIAAYQATGSVWKAGKLLGMAGQTVHERLKALNYKLPGSGWTEEEEAELRALVDQLTIAQIANRLGRPYNGVALKISRLGIGQRFGNNQKKKVPRNGLYTKAKCAEYAAEMEISGTRITTYAKQNGLKVESLIRAMQRNKPEWFEQYSKTHAIGPQIKCPYCETEFWPQSKKQVYCNRECGSKARVDNDYFGGKRRQTVGLLEGVCQLCGQHTPKGLSSHHVLGKENDPNNEYLLALCQGCHQIVTILGGRRFAATVEAWEVLIQLVIMRKNGHDPNFGGVYTSVDIEIIVKDSDEWRESMTHDTP